MQAQNADQILPFIFSFIVNNSNSVLNRNSFKQSFAKENNLIHVIPKIYRFAKRITESNLTMRQSLRPVENLCDMMQSATRESRKPPLAPFLEPATTEPTI